MCDVKNKVSLIFGTYKLSGDILKDSAMQALDSLYNNGYDLLLDSAVKYGNTNTLIKIQKQIPMVKIGWKLSHEKSLKRDLQIAVEKFPSSIFRVLLHNWYGVKKYAEFQNVVEEICGTSMPIGICNASIKNLQDFIANKARKLYARLHTLQKFQIQYALRQPITFTLTKLCATIKFPLTLTRTT
jgi:hypothetical protein